MSSQNNIKVALAPVLFQCAKDKQRITYGEAADEVVRLGLVNSAHHRTIGPAVGALMDDLRKPPNEKIPPLNCLVVNGGSGVASGGAGYYVRRYVKDETAYKNLNVSEKRQLLENRIWPDVYAYDWYEMLSSYFHDKTGHRCPIDFELKISNKNRAPAENREADGEGERMGFSGQGESPEHKALRLYVRDHPECVKAALPVKPESYLDRTTEYQFPSLDSVDVLYAHPTRPVVIEVKSAKSEQFKKEDFRRGIYQCVKYRALLQAEIEAETSFIPSGRRRPSVTAVLVTESALPKDLNLEAELLNVKHCKVRLNKHIPLRRAGR